MNSKKKGSSRSTASRRSKYKDDSIDEEDEEFDPFDTSAYKSNDSKLLLNAYKLISRVMNFKTKVRSDRFL